MKKGPESKTGDNDKLLEWDAKWDDKRLWDSSSCETKKDVEKKNLQLEQVNIFIYQVFPLLIKSQSQLSKPFILEHDFYGAPVEMVETKYMTYLKLVIRHFL